MVFDNKKVQDKLLELDYSVFYKNHPKAKNIWEIPLIIIYFPKIISIFLTDHPKKPSTILSLITFVLVIAKPSIKSTIVLKQIKNWPTNGFTK